MGTWGPGNFDNDRARDYLAMMLYEIVKEIESAFASKTNSDVFVAQGEAKIIPMIDIYITLSERYDSPHVDEEMAVRWRTEYLQAFDEDKSVNPRDFKTERRPVVVETFDRLDALIKTQGKFWL